MLRKFEKIGDKRPIHIITRSLNQYPNYKTSIEIEPIDKYKGSVVICGARNCSHLDELSTRGINQNKPELF